MKFNYNTAKFRNQTLGASLVTAIVICLAGSACAANWNGSVDNNWNNNANWDGGGGTIGSNALITVSAPNIATISATIPGNPADIILTGTGRLDHTAGTASTGGGNWLYVGQNGGSNCIYNLANTSGSGGTLTGFAQGSGTMTTNGGRLYVGGSFGGGGNGVANVYTSGNLTIGNDLAVGSGGGTGVVNVDAGTITTGGWNFIGKDEGGGGGNGTLNMAGGTLTNTGRTYVAAGATTGLMHLSGGTYTNVNNEIFDVGDNGGNGTVTLDNSASHLQANGEIWFGENNGTGQLNLSVGSITSSSWVAVGRDNGTGIVTMTGGTWTKLNGGSSFIIGSSGHGTMNQNGGLVDVQGGDTWMAENNVADFTLSGSGEFRASYFQVARNGGSTGNVHFDGGTLRVNEIVGGGGTENVHFNGTQIIAKIDEPNFIAGMDSAGAIIDAGGLKIDSAGHTLAVTQILTGTGGITKTGAGKLTLSAYNSYAGNNAVNAGELVLKAGSTGTGNLAVADGTALGVADQTTADQLVSTNATFGTTVAGTTLNIYEGNLAGVNPTAPMLKVTGNLVVSGNVTLNVTGSKFAPVIMPLVAYNAATRSGPGNFVLGSKPNGVVATLVDNPNYYGANQGLVYLNITSVSLPVWDATVNALWDTTTLNWIDGVTNLPSVYSDPAPVLFDDTVTGTTAGAVVLNGTVAPSDVVFNNTSKPYSLSGPGKITGPTGLTKAGASTLTISTANDYTGATTISGGILSVSSIANAASPSGIGASSVSPANLVFNGGQLSYTGSGDTTNRGFTIAAANSVFDVQGALTMSGTVSATAGQFRKIGAGTLTLSNPGANVLANGGGPGITVDQGSLVLSGGGTQTNSVVNDIWVGTTSTSGADLALNNTSLTSAGNYLAIARGSGTTGLTSTCTLTNSTLTTDNLSLGYSNGVGGYLATSVLTLNSSTYTLVGTNRLAESAGATGTVILNGASTMTSGDTNIAQGGGSIGTLDVKGTSVYTSNNRLLVGMDGGSVGNVIIEDSGSVVVHTYASIGYNGGGSMTVKNSGSFTNSDDLSVSENGDVPANVTLQDSGAISVAGHVYVGRDGGRVGIVTQTGGTFTGSGTDTFQIGLSGQGSWLQSGGITNAGGWVSIGRNGGSTGILTVSGTGTFNQTGTDRALIIGEVGTGTLTIQGSATVSAAGANGLVVSNDPSGVGTVNLNGGTLVALKVSDGGGTSTFNFNGGVLKAGTGASLGFMSGLDTVAVNALGAFIDSNGQTIAIAQVLSEGGGKLTKQGAGTLQLNGHNSYLGTTTVAAGTLGGTGSVGGALIVPSAGSIAPGAAGIGTFSADDTLGDGSTIGGSYVCELAGASADKLALGGSLTISPGAVLNFSLLAPPTALSYVIASYTSHSGTFTEQNVPAGFHVVYNPTSITLEYIATPYSNWAVSHGLNPLTNGAPGADPDGDGQVNSIEFALGGDPTNATNNAKTFSLIADSSADVDSLRELLLTIAVRSGTPAFTGSPSPTATQDGFTYTIEGSTTLSSFTTTVTPVTLVAPPAPNATPPAGYEYRTFSLSGSNGLPSKGFLRVKVSN